MDYKVYMREQADDLSVVGLKHCYQKEKPTVVKIMWVFLVICGIIIAITLIYDRIAHYVSFPVTTTYEISPKPFLEYPSITLCTTNRISKEKAEEYGLVDYFKAFLPPFYQENEDPGEPPSNVSFSRELRDALSPDIIPLCTWMGEPCPNNIFEYIYTDAGRCLNINPGAGNISIERAGIGANFGLYLVSKKDDYFITEDETVGYSIFFHHPKVIPRMVEFGKRLRLGEENQIFFDITKLQRQKYPYGNCKDDQGYQKEMCELKCRNDVVIETCNCTPVYFPSDDVPECDFYQERCADRAITNYLKNKKKYNCDCPQMCQEYSYDLKISGATFSEHTITKTLQALNISIPYETFVKTFIGLRFAINRMEVTKIMTVPAYSFLNLMSDIGGALSLMLGATLLTLVQVIEMGVNMCILPYRKKNPKEIKNYDVNNTNEHRF